MQEKLKKILNNVNNLYDILSVGNYTTDEDKEYVYVKVTEIITQLENFRDTYGKIFIPSAILKLFDEEE